MNSYLKFYDDCILVFNDDNCYLRPPYYMDKESIRNALNLVRDVFKSHEKLFYWKDSLETFSGTTGMISYRLGSSFQICLGGVIHKFYTDKFPYGLTEVVDTDFGLDLFDEAIKIILS